MGFQSSSPVLERPSSAGHRRNRRHGFGWRTPSNFKETTKGNSTRHSPHASRLDKSKSKNPYGSLLAQHGRRNNQRNTHLWRLHQPFTIISARTLSSTWTGQSSIWTDPHWPRRIVQHFLVLIDQYSEWPHVVRFPDRNIFSKKIIDALRDFIVNVVAPTLKFGLTTQVSSHLTSYANSNGYGASPVLYPPPITNNRTESPKEPSSEFRSWLQVPHTQMDHSTPKS